ncbi:TspO/MBR family protein [Acidisphaera rubrifaciens]|uniref:Transcriptional negative regulator of photosynthesis CrtK/TspO/MBR n=1 Tax=Acidisphaera rubrifaciens HS-AP3 TaxID=1231350 RepID=A0A0D6P7D2_9PROT|nr:TspO/MBR family protein [Acidisphaera rubrifaciens]GAN77246.1 transcriptional negative regulator of photosynthesis CrtK/TspO/MBR [Acidisphaera rubrifaciens HS-AP3]
MSVLLAGGWQVPAGAVAWAVVVAVAGGLLTEIGPWYRRLRKPSWQPPDWAFGPAWTLIFLLAAAAAVLAWNGAPEGAAHLRVVVLYVVNGVLNVGWSLFFFRLRRPDLALVEVVALWLSILAMVIGVAPLSGLAALLLAPYLAWVTFAAALNRAVVRLNPRRA